VGDPQQVPPIANPQIYGLQKFVGFLNHQQMWQFAICEIALYYFVVIKPSANPQIHIFPLTYVFRLKCCNSKCLRNIFIRILGASAMNETKRVKLFKRGVSFLLLFGEKFADLRLADQLT
jgi:hypothetical protein